MNWHPGIIIPGYGVASGKGNDRRYPAGTLRLQQPFFLEKGIDLSPYFLGTVNVDLAPFKPVPQRPLFDGTIRWAEGIEERFVISPVEFKAGDRQYSGLWYYPHPETKPGHVQRDTVAELLLPWIDGLATGEAVFVGL